MAGVEVVVQTATREVLCLQAPGEGGGEPRLRWQVPGYGQTNNAPLPLGTSRRRCGWRRPPGSAGSARGGQRQRQLGGARDRRLRPLADRICRL